MFPTQEESPLFHVVFWALPLPSGQVELLLNICVLQFVLCCTGSCGRESQLTVPGGVC